MCSKWNLEYDVTTYENNRNNGAQYLQGNRNPFIDHPEYACKIWGDFNTTTQGICSSYTTAPNTITVTPASSSIAVGGTTTLGVSVDTGSSNVTWSSSNTSIATVSNGVVTGVAAGSVTITATSTVDTSIKGTATVTVKALSSLNVSGTPNITSYTAGQSFDSTGLIVTATYSDSSTANVTASVTWSPDPLTAGTTSVIGSYGNKTVSVSGITVNNNLTMEITKSNSGLSTTASSSNQVKSYSIKNGATTSGTMSISWGAGSYNSSTYNEFAIKNGTKIQSNDSTYVKTITVDLYGFLNSAVYANGSLVTGVDGTPTSNGYSKVLTYTINSTNWYIVGNSSEHDQFFYSILFNVGTDPSLLTPVTGVSLNESSITLSVNDTFTLVATVSPNDASNKNISWSSSDEEVATVTGGVVTAIKAGNAIITVTTSDGSFTATCEITVSSEPISHGGCGGSIAITSSLIAVLSAIGVTFILIKRKKYSR